MAATGSKKYPKAIELFLLAVTAPAHALSAIAVASYKKLVLVSLIARGSVAPLPKYAPSVVQRHLKAAAPEYVEIGAAFGTKPEEEVRRLMSQHAEAIGRDNNAGLLEQCAKCLSKRSIHKLTQTYLTLG